MTSTLRVRKKRAAARAASLCISCFVRAADTPKTVCSVCNDAAKERVRIGRLKRRAKEPSCVGALGKSPVRQILEAAADLDRLGHAADAMNVLKTAHRIAVQIHRYDEAAEALELLCRQAWASCRTPECITYARALLDLPLSANSEWRISGFLRLSRALTAVGKPREALHVLHEAAKLCNYTRVGALSIYLEVRAYAEAAAQMKFDSLRDYRLAVDIAEALTDKTALTFILNNFALAAGAFGQIRLARSTHLRAIRVATRRKIGWLTTYTNLSYAQSLLLFGRFDKVRAILEKSPTQASEHPSVTIKRAWIQAMLEGIVEIDLCSLEQADQTIDAAFESKEPARIGPVAAAYHSAYMWHHRKSEAKVLMKRALETLTESSGALWLVIELVRFGVRDELVKVARLFDDCGDNDIARALLLLIRGRLSQLAHERETAALLAGQSESMFRECGLHYLEAIAMETGGRVGEAQQAYEAMGALRDARRNSMAGKGVRSALTPRQREVVGCVIRGLDLKQTALHLRMSERTAENHLTAAMHSLGVKRRSELRHSPFVAHLFAADTVRESRPF